MKKGIFRNAKKISLGIIVTGVIVAIILFIQQTLSWQAYETRSMTYSFYNPFSGTNSYHSGADIGDMNFIKFLFSKYMNSGIYIEALSVIIVAIILAGFFYIFYYNQELLIEDDGINGKAILGKSFSVDFEQIVSVKKSWMGGLVLLTTGQQKIRFRLIKNLTNIIEVINKTAETNGKNTIVANENHDSVADELKKYKELLDENVISQEEYDAKKKQLLQL